MGSVESLPLEAVDGVTRLVGNPLLKQDNDQRTLVLRLLSLGMKDSRNRK